MVAPGWWTWAVVQDVMGVSRPVAEIFSFPSWASMRKFWRSRKSGASCARLPRSRGVLRAVSPGVGRNGFTPRFRGAWLGFLSPPSAGARDCCGTPAVHGFREHGGPLPRWNIPALRPAAHTGEGARRWWYP